MTDEGTREDYAALLEKVLGSKGWKPWKPELVAFVQGWIGGLRFVPLEDK